MTAISHNFSGYLWLSIYTYWPTSISWDDDFFHGSPGCGGRTWKTPWWSMRRHHEMRKCQTSVKCSENAKLAQFSWICEDPKTSLYFMVYYWKIMKALRSGWFLLENLQAGMDVRGSFGVRFLHHCVTAVNHCHISKCVYSVCIYIYIQRII